MVLPTKLLQRAEHGVLLAIARILPTHSKRLVLWTSLYGQMCKHEEQAIEGTKKLNELMHLATDDKAAELPIKLGKVIWSDLTRCLEATKDAVQGKCLSECFTRFIQGIPASLRYASEQLIREDFEQVVSMHRQLVPRLS